jgi:hypothetical protein
MAQWQVAASRFCLEKCAGLKQIGEGREKNKAVFIVSGKRK